jgi:FMN phosphatase YigB (HAD superfamily)
MIRAILFDIHGVLFSSNLEQLAWQELANINGLSNREISQLQIDFQIQAVVGEFLVEFCPLCNSRYCSQENLLLPHNITQWLKGKRDWQTVYDESVLLIDTSYEVKVNQYEPELMKSFLKYFLDPALYQKVVTPIQSGLDLLTSVKNLDKYKLFLASNSLQYCYDYYVQNYSKVTDSFDDYFLSQTLQCMKNEPMFFENIAKKHGIGLNEMFLIDDNCKTIAAVSNVGVSGWCFEDNKEKINQLIEQLKKG